MVQDYTKNGIASPSSSSLLLQDDRRLFPLRWLSLQRSGRCLTSSEYHSPQTKRSSNVHGGVVCQSRTPDCRRTLSSPAEGVTMSSSDVIDVALSVDVRENGDSDVASSFLLRCVSPST